MSHKALQYEEACCMQGAHAHKCPLVHGPTMPPREDCELPMFMVVTCHYLAMCIIHTKHHGQAKLVPICLAHKQGKSLDTLKQAWVLWSLPSSQIDPTMPCGGSQHQCLVCHCSHPSPHHSHHCHWQYWHLFHHCKLHNGKEATG